LDGRSAVSHSGGRVPAPDRRALVQAIREAVKLAIEATSLRKVARAVGMSPMGLKHFAAGTTPYSATFRKLLAWYAVHQAEAGGFSVETVRGALEVMTDGIPESARGRVSAALLDELLKFHRELGTRPPAWLATLRAEAADE
jgi:AcrR family transcriptional regulator